MKNSKRAVYSKLKLSVSGREGRIRIGNGVINVLGNPEYVCIYISTDNDALMVRPCGQKDFLSTKVKKEANKEDMRVYSLQFVLDLFDKNGWDNFNTYQMPGTYLKTKNAVVFCYKDATSK